MRKYQNRIIGDLIDRSEYIPTVLECQDELKKHGIMNVARKSVATTRLSELKRRELVEPIRVSPLKGKKVPRQPLPMNGTKLRVGVALLRRNPTATAQDIKDALDKSGLPSTMDQAITVLWRAGAWLVKKDVAWSGKDAWLAREKDIWMLTRVDFSKWRRAMKTVACQVLYENPAAQTKDMILAVKQANVKCTKREAVNALARTRKNCGLQGYSRRGVVLPAANFLPTLAERSEHGSDWLLKMKKHGRDWMKGHYDIDYRTPWPELGPFDDLPLLDTKPASKPSASNAKPASKDDAIAGAISEAACRICDAIDAATCQLEKLWDFSQR